MKQIRIPPFVGLAMGILAVSTASLLIRLAQNEAPSFVIAAGRLTLAAVFLAPFAIKNLMSLSNNIQRTEAFLLIFAGLFLGLHFATWITSLEYTTVASSVVIVTTAPLWVALFSPVFLKEKLTYWIILGLVISLAGSIIVGLSGACGFASGKLVCESIFAFDGRRMLTGNLLALAGAFFSAGYLMIGRKVRSSLNLVTYTFLVYSVAAIILILLVIGRKQTFSGYSTTTYVLILGLAIIPQLVGHSSFNWALKYLPAALVSIALLGEPIGTVLLSFTFLKETPTIFEIIGGILILVGIFVATMKRPVKSEIIEPVG